MRLYWISDKRAPMSEGEGPRSFTLKSDGFDGPSQSHHLQEGSGVPSAVLENDSVAIKVFIRSRGTSSCPVVTPSRGEGGAVTDPHAQALLRSHELHYKLAQLLGRWVLTLRAQRHIRPRSPLSQASCKAPMW